MLGALTPRRRSSSKADADVSTGSEPLSPHLRHLAQLSPSMAQKIRAALDPSAQLTKLDLRGTSEVRDLDAELKSDLIKSITASSTIKEINLAGCGLSEVHLPEIKRLLFLSKSIESLELSANLFEEGDLVQLMQSVPYFTSLSHLGIAVSLPPTSRVLRTAQELVERAKGLRQVHLTTQEAVETLGGEEAAEALDLLAELDHDLATRSPTSGDGRPRYSLCAIPAANFPQLSRPKHLEC